MSFQSAALPALPCVPSCSGSLPTAFLSFKKTTVSEAPTVLVDFGPVRGEQVAGVDRSASEVEFKSWPIFNDDRLHFTPCFMLHHDKVRTPNNLSAFMGLHQNRIEEITEEREGLLVPKPSKANSFCCVCRTFFDDYLEHVARPDHTQLMRQNKFAREIEVLCGRFSHQAGKPRAKGKAIRKENSRKYQRGEVKQLMRSTSAEVSSLIFGEVRS